MENIKSQIIAIPEGKICDYKELIDEIKSVLN